MFLPEGVEVPAAAVQPQPQPGSVLLHTSGSTGAPKAVELTEDRLLHVARAEVRHNRLTPAARGFSPLPLFHINAQVVALLASLYAGAALLVDRRFRRHGFWEMLADRDVTWINAVPAILTILAEYPVPVPTLYRSDAPPINNCSTARICASARSLTWI